MENRPTGRPKNITGTGKPVAKRGEGLNTGKPVGKADGYAQRPGAARPGASSGGSRPSASFGTQSSQGSQRTTRGLGGGKLIIIIIAAVVLLGGGGGLTGLFGNLLGGSSSSLLGSLGGAALSSLGGGLFGGSSSSNSGSTGIDLSSLLGGFTGGGSVSTGWTREANVGKLDETVASGARSKYTTLQGNGKDTVTIMVYMCGTDLESKSGMASNDLQEMAKATLSNKVNLIVFTGGCKKWKIDGISNTVNQIYKVENGKLTCLEADYGKDSMVKPATLTGFIQYCTKNYPASRQMLIFWDHGGGSLSGYGYDEKNSSAGSMSLDGINTALKNAGTKFDVIGFDACLMATLETGLMLDPYADYMIASEETEPGIGWYYTNWLTKLSENTSISTPQLGKLIVDDFVAECNRRCAGQKTTLSVVDLAELSATAPKALKTFATGTSKLISGKDYKTVSDARSETREFAASNKIDQIDLVHLCYNLETQEAEALAKALLGAVKYNKTSSSMSNAYGLSIYFPYQRTSKVKSAVTTYKAIGMDSEYSRCIQQFANLELGGQASSGGSSSALSSLAGNLTGGGLDLSGIGDVLGGLLGGGELFGKEIDLDTAAQTIAENQFDGTALKWTVENGKRVLRLSEQQWSLVHDLELNVFYDDGEGYIDLGLDNVYDFTDDGALLGEYDGTWLAINQQPVAYYYLDSTYTGSTYTIHGRVPVLLNGERAELLIVFDNGHPNGYVAGVRAVYADGETETVAKGMTELTDGDRIEFICDYYTYDGKFQDSYLLGDELIYHDGDALEISNVYIVDDDTWDSAKATYVFTDIYNQEYWTEVIP